MTERKVQASTGSCLISVLVGLVLAAVGVAAWAVVTWVVVRALGL